MPIKYNNSAHAICAYDRKCFTLMYNMFRTIFISLVLNNQQYSRWVKFFVHFVFQCDAKSKHVFYALRDAKLFIATVTFHKNEYK